MYAYILGQLNRSKARDVTEAVADNAVVQDMHILFGEWDFVVEVEARNEQAISEFVIDELRAHDDVALTSTLIVAE